MPKYTTFSLSASGDVFLAQIFVYCDQLFRKLLMGQTLDIGNIRLDASKQILSFGTSWEILGHLVLLLGTHFLHIFVTRKSLPSCTLGLNKVGGLRPGYPTLLLHLPLLKLYSLMGNFTFSTHADTWVFPAGKSAKGSTQLAEELYLIYNKP